MICIYNKKWTGAIPENATDYKCQGEITAGWHTGPKYRTSQRLTIHYICQAHIPRWQRWLSSDPAYEGAALHNLLLPIDILELYLYE